MATNPIGILTDIGKDKIRQLPLKEGFVIVPSRFSVSSAKSDPDIENVRTLTAANGSEWYTGPVGARELINADTIRFSVQIPPAVTATLFLVEEIYLFARDVDDVEFLLAVAHTADGDLYDPSGTSTFRLQIKTVNVNITESFSFEYTEAIQIGEHNIDPNAHPEMIAAMKKAGIFLQPAQHRFIGQNYDEFATFDAAVQDEDLVYQHIDGKYYQAIADGSEKSIVVGSADVTNSQVGTPNSIASKSLTFSPNTKLYLSNSTPGAITSVVTGQPVGYSKDAFSYFFFFNVEEEIHTDIDTVVSDLNEFNHYASAQDAIDATPDGGTVRFDKIYEVEGPVPLTSAGKKINYLFTGTSSGIRKFPGQNEIQDLSFVATPDSGDFLLSHAGNDTTRLPFNVSAGAVETALEALTSIQDVTVTGDVTNGFTIEFVGVDGLQDQTPVAIGTNLGVNSVQLLDFDNNDFDSGSFKMTFNGDETATIFANNVNSTTIQTELNLLPSVVQVVVTTVPSPPIGTTQFLIEFQSTDGLQPQNLITVSANSLADSNPNPIIATITDDTVGVLPDNLLLEGVNAVAVLTTITQEGKLPGTTTGLLLSSGEQQFIGLGIVEDFLVGIDLNLQSNTRIEMFFRNNLTPIDYSGGVVGDFNPDGSLGLPNQNNEDSSFRELAKVKAQIVPDKTILVTPAEITLLDGSKHGMVIDQGVSHFNGATINLETGVNSNGPDLLPYTVITPGFYFKYAVMLQVDDTIRVLSPPNESATPNGALEPVLRGGILRAIILVKDDGAGGIEIIDQSAITNVFVSGAFAKDVFIYTETSPGGQSTFSVTDFAFDPDNTVLDLLVNINGTEYPQDVSGGSTPPIGISFIKNSGTEIEFFENDGVNPVVAFAPPVDADIEIKYEQTNLNDRQDTVNQVAFKTFYFDGDGGSDYDLDILDNPANWTFSPDDNVKDIEIKINGNDGEAGRDFTKLNSTTIRLLDPLDPGQPMNMDSFVRLGIKSREYSTGSGTAGTSISTSDEGGAAFPSKVSKYDFVGDTIQASETSPGNHQIQGLSNEVTMLGDSGLESFVTRTVLDLVFRKYRGVNGISITQAADGALEWGLSLATYFMNCVDNIAGLVIPTGQNYDPGSKKLFPFRNGLRIINSSIIGLPVDQYIEGPDNLSITVPATVPSIAGIDHFCFINEDVIPVSVTILSGPTIDGNVVLTVPTYSQGNNRLRVWRNGFLMNSSGIGEPVDRYAETTTTTITLDSAANLDDWFLVEFMGDLPSFREEFQILTTGSNTPGSTLTFVNTIPVATPNYYIFRNGQLMNNLSTGDSVDNYSEAGPNTITLAEPADLNDHFIMIAK